MSLSASFGKIKKLNMFKLISYTYILGFYFVDRHTLYKICIYLHIQNMFIQILYKVSQLKNKYIQNKFKIFDFQGHLNIPLQCPAVA